MKNEKEKERISNIIIIKIFSNNSKHPMRDLLARKIINSIVKRCQLNE